MDIPVVESWTEEIFYVNSLLYWEQMTVIYL